MCVCVSVFMCAGPGKPIPPKSNYNPSLSPTPFNQIAGLSIAEKTEGPCRQTSHEIGIL